MLIERDTIDIDTNTDMDTNADVDIDTELDVNLDIQRYRLIDT